MLEIISNSINVKKDDGTDPFDTSQTSSMTLSTATASQIHLALEALLITNSKFIDDEYKRKLSDAGFNLPTEVQCTETDDEDESLMEVEDKPSSKKSDIDISQSIQLVYEFYFKPTGYNHWSKIPFQSDTSSIKEALLFLTLKFAGLANVPTSEDYFVPFCLTVDLSGSQADIKQRVKQYHSMFQLSSEHKGLKKFIACIIKSCKDNSYFFIVMKRIQTMLGFTWEVAVLTLKEEPVEVMDNIQCFLDSLVKSCPTIFLQDCDTKFYLLNLFSEKAKGMHAFMGVTLSENNDDLINLSWLVLSYVHEKSMRKISRGPKPKRGKRFERLEGIFEELTSIDQNFDLLSELRGPWFWSSLIIGVELNLVEFSVAVKNEEFTDLTEEQLTDMKNKIDMQYQDSTSYYQSKSSVLPLIFSLLCYFSCLSWEILFCLQPKYPALSSMMVLVWIRQLPTITVIAPNEDVLVR